MTWRQTSMKRLILIFGLALLYAALPARGADSATALAIDQVLSDTHHFYNRSQAQDWLARMSRRLERKIENPFYRMELLKVIHDEAARAGLPPELVLAVVQIESGFDRFAISRYGALGLMQVMPFWKKEIGHPRDNLFHPRTNLRYGCTILKHYLDQENGNLATALARYNGSAGKEKYPRRVLGAMRARWNIH
jgi:soluble lytic murein transglycosylase-like protein